MAEIIYIDNLDIDRLNNDIDYLMDIQLEVAMRISGTKSNVSFNYISWGTDYVLIEYVGYGQYELRGAP